jgi:hypothetical protein
MTPATRMPVACLNACWLTPDGMACAGGDRAASMPIRARIMLVKRDHESCDGKRGRIVAAVHDRLVRMTDGDGAVCLTRSSPVETNVRSRAVLRAARVG